jgi:hypothetical protein
MGLGNWERGETVLYSVVDVPAKSWLAEIKTINHEGHEGTRRKMIFLRALRGERLKLKAPEIPRAKEISPTTKIFVDTTNLFVVSFFP